ncbi:glycosyltransferase family 4 protein [Rhodococcus sp. NPDC059234]|uniref:glycosyltransferase family 4 protein n=1 Tax=Rhodococcus sp. NPDC059234 TaxID=3346781 RepID=UPI00366A72A5
MGLHVVMIGVYPLEPGVIVGGIESVTSTLVPALAAQDAIDKVTVIRFHHGETSRRYRRESEAVEVYLLRGQDRFRTITRSFRDVRRARRLIGELKPDIVHGQEIGWYGDIAARCSPNSVVTVHGLPHVEIGLSAQTRFRDRLRAKPVADMVKRVLREAKVVISISEYDRRELTGLVCGTRVSIPNPTAREFFALAPSGPTEPRLLFAGVLSPRKNPEGLLNAFAIALEEVPSARLVMVGPCPDGEYQRSITERAERLGLSGSLEFLGLVDNERLCEEIAKARAVVLFSREETAPTILAQAMAAGKPAVASRVGGVAEMVRDGESGFVVESGDEAGLAQRMVTVLADQDLCLQMGRRGHDIALSRFEPAAVASRTVDAYRLALNPPGARRRRYFP